MHYEINVSKCDNPVGRGTERPRYSHFFATAERSITTAKQCKAVYDELVKAFPEPDYQISITRNETTGYMIDPSDIGGRGESKY